MGRMKKGEEGHEEATKKWRETMEKKYGGASEYMRKIGSKGGRNGKGPNYKGGFANPNIDPRVGGAKGGRWSFRGYKLIKRINENTGLYQNLRTNELEEKKINV